LDRRREPDREWENNKVYLGSLVCGEQAAIKLSKALAEASKDFLRKVYIITKLKKFDVVDCLF
jgi:hypothetical protein